MEHESPSGGTTASDPSPNHGFEAEIILRIVQTLDRWYLGVQNLARSVGILGSGRESIQDYEAEGLGYTEFPDLSHP